MESFNLHKRISKFLALTAILLGFLVLFGWLFNINFINLLFPNWVNTKLITSIGFILFGLSVWLLNKHVSYHLIAYFFATVVLVIAIFTLCEYLFLIPQQIHQLLVTDFTSDATASWPMSPITAFNFVLLCIVLLTTKLKKFVCVSQILIVIVLLISFLIGLGYLFGADLFLGFFNLNMSIITALTFILLCLSILFLNHDVGLIKFLSQPLPGSKMARRLLPLLVFIPILLGLLRLWGQKIGFYNTEYGTAFYTIIIIFSFIAIVFILAWIINQSETVNKKLAEDIQQSYSYIRAVFENIDEGIITINDESLIESINSKGLKIFGYELNELLHQDLTMLMPKHFRPLHKNGIQRYQETGIAHVIGKGRIELQGLRKDGTIFPIELSVTQSWVNKKRMYTGVVRDITQNKKIEEYQRQLTSIVESSSDAIISMDLNGIITSWNPAAELLYGYTATEAINQSTAIFIPDEKKSELDLILQKIKSGESIPYFETIRKHKDGHFIQVGIAISVIKDTDGHPIGASIIASDITERKKIDKLKNEFISLVSHELRTPLTSIQGSLSLLLAGVAGSVPEKAQHLLSIAKQNSERLIRLINDLLDVEKIESGKIEFQLENLSIKSIVKEAIKANQAYAQKFNMNIFLVKEFDAKVLVDRDRLLQVLTNLISNAVKFSTGNYVNIQISKNNNFVRVCVTNAGPGIPKEFHKRVFQKFVQANPNLSRSVAGTGLGLSISKEIVEKLNGHIGFNSEINKETTFYFDLPMTEENIVDQSKFFEKKSTILICEDDKDIANYLKLILNEHQFNVIVSHSAASAKQILYSNNIDALLLDLILPDQTGISFIKELRQQYSISSLPIIVISIIAQQGKKELNGNLFPVLDWIDKPINLNHFMDTIQSLKKFINNKTPNILHVEDDNDLLELIANLLKDKVNIYSVQTVKQAKSELAKNKYDLVILDLMLPDGSGIELIPIINKFHIPIIVFSAHQLPKDYLQNVTQHFAKSQISIEDFIKTIKSTLVKKQNTEEKKEK